MVGRFLHSYLWKRFSNLSWPFKQTSQCRLGRSCSHFTPLPLPVPGGAGRVMTAPLLANKATFPLCSHLLFPTVYQCALIHLFLISHLSQNVQQICSFCGDVPVCLHTPRSLCFRAAVWLLHQTLVEVVCGEQKLVSQAEGNKLCSANTYCSMIQVIRIEVRVWVCVLWCL